MSSASEPPDNQLVFYLDHCLQCEKVVTALCAAGVKLECHLDHFRGDEEDAVWIPVVSQRGWIILTKDKMIRRRPLERDALLSAGARAFIVTAGKLTGDELAELLCRHIKKISRLARNTKPPFVMAVSKNGVKPLECK